MPPKIIRKNAGSGKLVICYMDINQFDSSKSGMK